MSHSERVLDFNASLRIQRYKRWKPGLNSFAFQKPGPGADHLRMQRPSFFIHRFLLLGLLGHIALSGCKPFPEQFIEERPTATLLMSPTITATATATATPTPTAEPLAVQDGLPNLPQTPNPLGLSVRCGVADLFDYPLDPPDGESATGGRDFGVFRDRYQGFHTGEDWWYERRASLGKPIYSIGNGRVRYVAPYGWGDDLGTLVIEHVLPDGRHIYSFYGHIDPESLSLRVGGCVQRGEQIGLIGDPRSSPHLHFEIRIIFADSPGPGYWSIDPEKSGWSPPSETIEFSRYAADQRLLWWEAIEASSVRELGRMQDYLYLSQEDADLVVRDLRSGVELLREAMEGSENGMAWDPRTGLIYGIDVDGQMAGFLLEAIEFAGEVVLRLSATSTTADLELSGVRQIIALEGGVLLEGRGGWQVIDNQGGLFWWAARDPIQSFIVHDDGIIAATAGQQGDLWTVTRTGAQPWDTGLSGKLFKLHGTGYLYADDGFYRLHPDQRAVERILGWSSARMSWAGVFPGLEDEIIVEHRDAHDHRLLTLDGHGSLIRDRSIAWLNAQDISIEACFGSSWLLVEDEQQSATRVRLIRLKDDDQGVEIFQTFIRPAYDGRSSMSCLDGTQLFLDLGGKRLLNLDLALYQPKPQE